MLRKSGTTLASRILAMIWFMAYSAAMTGLVAVGVTAIH